MILAWLIGFGYTFAYSVGINKVIGGVCYVYYIPDKTARKVCICFLFAQSKPYTSMSVIHELNSKGMQMTLCLTKADGFMLKKLTIDGI